jgi:hypothetical protein
MLGRVDVRAQEPAALSLRASLRRGRVLSGWPLAVAVALRELPCALLSLGESLHVTRVAPGWVVVEDRLSGEVLRRIPVGRVAGAGEHLLDQVRIELRERTREEFLAARPA